MRAKKRLLMFSFTHFIIPWILLTERIIFIHPIFCNAVSHSPGNGDLNGKLSSGQFNSESICRSCKGANSSCHIVAGIFTRPQLNIGYNVIARIPPGACNLNISEIRNSPNHLALRRSKNLQYLFNGDWRLSQSGIYELSGGGKSSQYAGKTLFYYQRQDLNSFESITSEGGPLEEALDLVVLYQQHPNPGIRYEYVIPAPSRKPLASLSLPLPYKAEGANLNPFSSSPSAATLSSLGSFQHQLPQPILNLYNSLSVFPARHPAGGGGSSSAGTHDAGEDSNGAANHIFHNHPHRHNHHHLHQQHLKRQNQITGSVSGFRSEDRIGIGNSKHPVSPSSGDGPPPPSPASSSTSSDKKFYWKITGYTNCSEGCGGGMQRSIVRCIHGLTGIPVSDRRCSEEEPRPATQIIRCNLKPCPAEWVTGPWSNCSDGASGIETPDNGDDSKVRCGFIRHRTRSVHCQQRISPSLTMRVAEGACLQRKPEEEVPCASGSRPCNQWQVSEWGECSTQCGNGVRKRSVKCIGTGSHPGDLDAELPEEECNQREKPGGLTGCNMGSCEDNVTSWFTSEWSPAEGCSQKCGSGVQTRLVICAGAQETIKRMIKEPQDNQTYYSYSFLQTEPSMSEFKGYLHNNQSTSPIETNLIEDETEAQYQDRSLCDESKKPQEERECFSDAGCAVPSWFVGEWGKCSSSCQDQFGIRTRQLLCVLYSRGRFKVTSRKDCPSETKPVEKESCEGEAPCNHSKHKNSIWFTTDWGECSALCGGGIQKRRVRCRNIVEHDSKNGNWSRGNGISSTLCSDEDRPIEKRSCNEQKCTTTTASIANVKKNITLNEIVKDEPQEKQQEHELALAPAPPDITSPTPTTFTTVTESKSEVPPESESVLEETPLGEIECTDEYRNCALVVQARLCRYKYYRSVCCHSCTDYSV